MKRYIGGCEAPGGYFWHFGEWNIVSVNGDAGTLPGGAADEYVRLPFLAMIVVAVLVSFAMVLFLPFIGFALLVTTVARGLGGRLRRLFRRRTATAIAH
jgi:hypothetical protein